MSNIIHGIAKTVEYTFKAIETGEAVYDSYKTVKNQELSPVQKGFRITANVVFSLANCADLGTDIAGEFGKVNSDIRFGSKCTVAALDVTRSTVKIFTSGKKIDTDQFIDTVAVVIFRVAALGDFIVNHKESWCCGHQKKIDVSSDVLLAAGVALRARKSAVNIYNLAYKYFQSKKGASTAKSQAESNPPTGAQPGSSRSLSPEEEDYCRGVINTYNQGDNIQSFETIPDIYQEDSVLKQWVCPITNKAIRTICVVKATLEDEEPIYYEKKEIDSALESGNRPSSWPEKILFTAESVIPSKGVQRLINKRLLTLQEDLGNALRNVESNLNQE